MLVTENNIEVHTQTNMVECLLQRALQNPYGLAFVLLENGGTTERRISFLELGSHVKTLSLSLLKMNVRGQRLLLFYNDVLEFITAFLATQYAGGIPVPVAYSKGHKGLDILFNILRDAQAQQILCTQSAVPVLQKALAENGLADITVTATEHLHTPDEFATLPKPLYHDIAFIQYTSGSTGQPKGVVISQQNVLCNQQLIQAAFGCDERSVILSWLPFHHDMGLIGNLLHALYAGCTCVVMPPLDFLQSPLRWLQAISTYRVTHSGGPNFAYDACVARIAKEDLELLDLSCWKVAYNGSEPVRAGTLEKFATYFGSAGFTAEAFHPCYGLAEATLLVSGRKITSTPTRLLLATDLGTTGTVTLTELPGEATATVVSAGTIAAGIDLVLVNEQGALVHEPLRTGEICIAGNSVTSGYWNKDNAAFFFTTGGRHYFKTGDTGYRYNGELFIHGRLREMIIVRGQNIYPYDLEQEIAAGIAAISLNGVAVFAKEDGREEMIVVAEISRTAISGLQPASIFQQIDRILLATVGTAAADIVLTLPLGIPRTTSGKLQRVKCRELYLRQGFSVIAVKSETVPVMASLVRDPHLLGSVLNNADYSNVSAYLVNLLAVKTGGTVPGDEHTSLTAWGLDSLRAVELVNIINKELKISIDPAKAYQDNTLAGLAQLVETVLWLKDQPTSGEGIAI